MLNVRAPNYRDRTEPLLRGFGLLHLVVFSCSEKKLVPFLRLLLKTASLVEHYYQPWSYTKQTGTRSSPLIRSADMIAIYSGFNDALHSLDRLTAVDFHLPINMSVRRFMNNRDLIE